MPLDIAEIDLQLLVLARNDTAPESTWYFDPEAGTCLYFGLDDDTDLDALRGGRHVVVPTSPQPDADIEAFLATVDEAAAAELLRALRQRRGRKRFAGVIARLGLQETWQEDMFARESVRAIDWLCERALVDVASADRLRAELDARLRPVDGT